MPFPPPPQLTPSVSSFLQCRRRKTATGCKNDTKNGPLPPFCSFCVKTLFRLQCRQMSVVQNFVVRGANVVYQQVKPWSNCYLTLFISCIFIEFDCSFMTPTNAPLIYRVIQTDGLILRVNGASTHARELVAVFQFLCSLYGLTCVGYAQNSLEFVSRSPLINAKNLVLHSSHFVLNWRCCTTVC